MSSEVSLANKSFWVSNRIARHLIEFAVERGAKIAVDDIEAGFVKKLSDWYNTDYWNGIDLELDVLFPTHVLKEFWAKVFSTASSESFVEQARLEKAFQISEMLLETLKSS